MQGAAQFHHQIADAILPYADAVFADTAAFDPTVDVRDPPPPLVERLVALQGGHCGYEMVEHGTRFFFVLPKDAMSPPLPAVHAATP